MKFTKKIFLLIFTLFVGVQTLDAQSNSLSDGEYLGTITCSASGSGSRGGGSGSGLGRGTGQIKMNVVNGRVTGSFSILLIISINGSGRHGAESGEQKIWQNGNIEGTASSFSMTLSSSTSIGSVTDRHGKDNFTLPPLGRGNLKVPLRIVSKRCDVVKGTFKSGFSALAKAARNYGLRATAKEEFTLVKQGSQEHDFSASPQVWEEYTDIPQSARLAGTILMQQMIITGNTGDDGISISERMTDAHLRQAIQAANGALATVNQMLENPPTSVGCDSRLQNQLYWYRQGIRMTMDELINNMLIQSSTLGQVQEIALLAVRAMSTGGNENILTEMTTSIEGLMTAGANLDDLHLLTAIFGLHDLGSRIDARR